MEGLMTHIILPCTFFWYEFHIVFHIVSQFHIVSPCPAVVGFSRCWRRLVLLCDIWAFPVEPTICSSTRTFDGQSLRYVTVTILHQPFAETTSTKEPQSVLKVPLSKYSFHMFSHVFTEFGKVCIDTSSHWLAPVPLQECRGEYALPYSSQASPVPFMWYWRLLGFQKNDEG